MLLGVLCWVIRVSVSGFRCARVFKNCYVQVADCLEREAHSSKHHSRVDSNYIRRAETAIVSGFGEIGRRKGVGVVYMCVWPGGKVGWE